MKKIEAIIFDMDGTLYSFDEKDESQFRSSEFGKEIWGNCIRFFVERFKISIPEAEKMYQDFNDRYNGEVSSGLEKELGVNRSEYFSFTWNLPVEKYVAHNQDLVRTLQELSIQSGVLTAAPKIWADKALNFLQIRNFFGEALFTGDPDIRKPNPQAFLQLANFWALKPEQILSIGDQERTDILPAQSLGMKTLRIAKQAETQADFSAPNVIAAIALLKEKGII